MASKNLLRIFLSQFLHRPLISSSPKTRLNDQIFSELKNGLVRASTIRGKEVSMLSNDEIQALNPEDDQALFDLSNLVFVAQNSPAATEFLKKVIPALIRLMRTRSRLEHGMSQMRLWKGTKNFPGFKGARDCVFEPCA